MKKYELVVVNKIMSFYNQLLKELVELIDIGNKKVALEIIDKYEKKMDKLF